MNDKGKGIVNSPVKKEDMCKVIVVFGSTSSISEVVESLKKVGLKRSAVELDEEKETKRRKLMFDAIKVNDDVVQESVQKHVERKSVRNIRRQIRKTGGGLRKVVKEPRGALPPQIVFSGSVLRKEVAVRLLKKVFVASQKQPPKHNEYFSLELSRFGSPLTVRSLKNMIRSKKPQIICILETKQKSL